MMDEPKPEERARIKIDGQLADAGWHVADRSGVTFDHNAIALAEGLLEGNKEADYLLFVDGKVIGILEAKRSDIDLEAAAGEQAANYAHLIPGEYPSWFDEPKVVLLANGEKILLRDAVSGEYQPIAAMPTPKKCLELSGVKSYWGGLPELTASERRALRACQLEAVTHLESSFRRGANRALVVLATGAGKTYTACMAAYRLLSFTPAKRLLFLVDRNNLGEQALNEFSTFRLTQNGAPLTDIFITERLKGNTVNPKASVTIATIQRVYSALTGLDARSDEDEDDEDRESNAPPVAVDGRLAKLPHDWFDAIIIDECHRSIYGRWRAVLEWFAPARFIGLTATPSAETVEFFGKNTVVNYTYEKSIADGINVDYSIYRIQTKSATEGVDVAQGETVDVYTRKTRETVTQVMEEPAHYEAKQLDRAIVQPDHIRQVLAAYKKAVYSEMYTGDLAREPDMASLPKTLIFAKSEYHARRIVEIAREVFAGQSPDFVQTITYSAGDPQKLIREFRNSRTFRIAVTVTLVATGTDIKPLEVILFMRDVNTYSLYVQMRGRGCRTINPDQLKAVTPNANGKEQFFVVDAVGVTEHPFDDSAGGESAGPAPLALPRLLEKLSLGIVSDDNLRLLASRLSRISAKSTEAGRMKFSALAGFAMQDLGESVFEALSDGSLPPFTSASEPNTGRRSLVAPLINNIAARDYLLELNAGYVVIQKPGKDEIVYTGFSHAEARSVLDGFEAFLKTNPTGNAAIAAVKEAREYRFDYPSLAAIRDDAHHFNASFSCSKVWNAYALIRQDDVVRLSSAPERDAVTNWLGLARFGLGRTPKLYSLLSSSQYFSFAQHYELWKGQKQRGAITPGQDDVLKEALGLILANGAIGYGELKAETNIQLLAEGVRAFGSPQAFDAELASLSSFFMKAI
ncbi:MAG: DEAD/DEAH box helicase family protein [Kiritimatiellia bacterium]